MSLLRRPLSHGALFALVAALAFALLPSLSQVLGGAQAAHGGSLTFTEVCTADGARMVAVDGGGEPAPQPDHLQHCPLCALHADGVVPARAQLVLPLLPLSLALPVAFLRAPRTYHAWASAQPRAPPRRA